MAFLGYSVVGLLAQRLSVPTCEVNGQGSSPAYAILFFFVMAALCNRAGHYIFAL